MLNQVDWYIKCIIMTKLKTNVNGLALVLPSWKFG